MPIKFHGETTEIRITLSRYIHLNPIQTSRFNKEIGVIFGVDYSTVSQSRARLKTKLKSNRKLKKQFHRILEQIDKLPILKI